MSGKAPERIWLWPRSAQYLNRQFRGARASEVQVSYIRADVADEWKRKMDVMRKALIEIEMFQGPAAYERLPRMARKALDECGVKK